MSRSGFPFAVTPSTVAGVAVASGPLIGCGPGPLPLPPGPALDALATRYQAPTGTVDPHLDWLPGSLEVGLDGVAIRAADASDRCDAAPQTRGPM